MSEDMLVQVHQEDGTISPTVRRAGGVSDWLSLLRPRQWTKNLVVFAGLLFTGGFVHTETTLTAGLAFAVFCVLSSTGYLINDITDAEHDRAHPRKAKRPIAARRIRPAVAWMVAVVLTLLALGSAVALDRDFAFTALAYLLVTVTYTLYWKHQVILDLLAITAGFLLRAIAGAVVLHVDVSPWLLVCVSLLALMLALGKRRYELAFLDESAQTHRPVLAEYSRPFLDQAMTIIASSASVTYAVYAISSHTAQQYPALVYTVPLVLYGILRYIYLVFHREQGGQPDEMLLTDRPLSVTILLWAAVVIVIFALT